MAGIGNGWNTGQYDNFEIAPLEDHPIRLPDEHVSVEPGHIGTIPTAANLYVLTEFEGGVRLTWGSKLPGATGYRVLMGETPETMTEVRDAGAATELRLTGLLAGHHYSFAVVPYNGSGEGPVSNTRQVTLPTAGRLPADRP